MSSKKNTVVKQLVLSEPQSMVFTSRKALNLDMAGQRAGKSQMIGVQSGFFVTNYPKLKGFIGANTYLQLTQSTLIKCTEIWEAVYGLTEWNIKSNRGGDFVIDKRPPQNFKVFSRFKDYNNIISFKNGAIIYVGSLDNYKAHDGKEFAWAHLDETKDTKEEAVTTVILARLSQSGLYLDKDDNVLYLPDATFEQVAGLRAWNPAYIHTSPAVGSVDWLLQMFDLPDYEPQIREDIQKPNDFFYNEHGNKSVTIFSTYHNEHNLPQGYIDNRLAVLSENEALKLVYGYPFSKTGGEYFPKFERRKHVRAITPQAGGIKHITLDFNVLPYMTLLAAQISYQMRFIDAQGVKHNEHAEGRVALEVLVIEFYREYCLETPLNTTEAVCRAFIDDHLGAPNLDIFYYGDASGGNRIAGLGELTNYKILEEELANYLVQDSKRVRGANIGVLQRRNLLNRVLEGKYANVELYFDEDMVETIRDFEYLKLGADGKLKEKTKDANTGAVYEKIGHTSDAAEYLICEVLKHYLNENM